MKDAVANVVAKAVAPTPAVPDTTAAATTTVEKTNVSDALLHPGAYLVGDAPVAREDRDPGITTSLTEKICALFHKNVYCV
jgi:hypothetical protein